jgi:hypothetical protein
MVGPGWPGQAGHAQERGGHGHRPRCLEDCLWRCGQKALWRVFDRGLWKGAPIYGFGEQKGRDWRMDVVGRQVGHGLKGLLRHAWLGG